MPDEAVAIQLASHTSNEGLELALVCDPDDAGARVASVLVPLLEQQGVSPIVATPPNGLDLNVRTGMGLVSQVFDEEDLSYLPGYMAIGHTRYSTTGSSEACNAQPIEVAGPNGTLALGHNGNIVNAAVLRADLQEQGVAFSSSTDGSMLSAR